MITSTTRQVRICEYCYFSHLHLTPCNAGDIKYRANPLVGAPDSMERGAVKEYFSLEMGLIQLQAGHTVLFHLDQVRSIVVVKRLKLPIRIVLKICRSKKSN